MEAIQVYTGEFQRHILQYISVFHLYISFYISYITFSFAFLKSDAVLYIAADLPLLSSGETV